LEGDEGKGRKTVEAEVKKRDDPRSQSVVTLEKEYSLRDSTHKLVFTEVPKRRVAGSLNLWVTSKGPVC
jgi:hypothetical protein